jgi:AcrR family transcriptional regulator
VAEEAGMSHANVYRHFPSKAGLLDAVTAQWLRPLEARLRSTAQGADPAYDKLERILSDVRRSYAEMRDSDPPLFAMFAEAAAKDRDVARRHRAVVRDEMRRVVDEGIGNSVFAWPDRRRAMALVFDVAFRFIQPALIAADAGQPRAAMDARFDTVMRLLLRALRSGRV